MILKLLKLLGAGLRNGLVAIGALAFIGTIGAIADYALTQGSGTNFASKVISTVHYAAHVLCDATVGQTQCAAVDSHGQLQIDVGTSNNNLYAAVTAGAAINGQTYPASSIGIGTKDPSGNIQPISAANPAPIIGPVNITPTDCSGTITSGGTAQNAFSAQTTLHGFTIVNIDTTEPLWISFTTTAAASGAGSYPLQAATATTFASPGSFTTPMGFASNHALSVIAATTSHKFTCTFW